MLFFSLVACKEIVYSILSSPFVNRERLKSFEMFYIDNENNRKIAAAIPSSFQVAWWAAGPRAQTFVQAVCLATPPSRYRRELIYMNDGVQVALDWKEDAGMTVDTPLILCLHGLGGDSGSKYMQVFTHISLVRGYRCVVYNRRGHGGMSLLPPNGNLCKKIFPRHSDMDDMWCVVKHLMSKYPSAPKYMIGFSCGANLMVNYLALPGGSGDFILSASVSNGYDIYGGTKYLKENDRVCDGILASFLKDILRSGRSVEGRKLAKIAGVDIDFDAVMKCNSLQDLEGLLVVPTYGYKSVKEYYDSDSCHKTIDNVKSPLLCIANRSDPFVHESMIEVAVEAAKRNPNIITIVTEHGGHIGWIEAGNPEPWYARTFFAALKA